MEFKKRTGRIWLEDPSGQEIAFVAFPARSEGVVTITSTYVSPVLRGQGVAAALMTALAKELRATGRKRCPFVPMRCAGSGSTRNNPTCWLRRNNPSPGFA